MKRLFLISLACTGFACGDTAEPPPLATVSSQEDAGIDFVDVGAVLDARIMDQGVSPVDSGEVLDASNLDAGLSEDAQRPDRNEPTDAFYPDALIVMDAQPSSDAMVNDSGPMADAGTLALTPNPLLVVLGESTSLSVNAASGSNVVWAVDGQVGGSAGTGTIAVGADQTQATYSAPRSPNQMPPSTWSISASANNELARADIQLQYPVPVLQTVSPNALPAGGPTTLVTLTGNKFTPQTSVSFAGASMSIISQTWSEITFEIPDTMLALPGNQTLSVRNPSPGGGTQTIALNVVIDELVVPSSVDPAIPALFDSASPSANVGRKPVITYPQNNVMVPRDFPEPTISWSQATGVTVCRASLTAPDINLQIYTPSDPSAYGPWENPYVLIETRIWQLMTFQFRTLDIEIQVACGEVLTTGGQVTLTNNEIDISDPVTYRVTTQNAGGRIVYFSGYENGLVRIDITGSTFQRINWLGPNPAFDTQTSKCVGCHSFNRDGTQLSYSTFDADYGTSSISNGVLTTILPIANPQSAEWTAMHPDGQYFAAINTAQALNLHEAATGNIVSTVPANQIAPYITQAFWSPLGDKIIFVASSDAGPEGLLSVEEGSIYTMDFSTTTATPTLTNPQLITAPLSSGGNVFYPSFSPDGEWIAFCSSSGGESYNNANSELWLVKSDLSVGPIRLDRANLGPQLYNSWPRWAPTVMQGKYWLVFSSQRDYGPFIDPGPQQLWVTQIDTNLLPNDPSHPALWLPGQFEFSGNLTAEWSISQ